MDRLRVVTFSPGGRPIVLLDINDGSAYSLVRDTLKIGAPARQPQWSQSIQRYGGSTLARESHDNGTLEAEWYISGAGVATTAMDRMEALMENFESLDENRYIEWRPENATKSVFYPVRGPAPWEFMYRWIEFQGTKTLHVKGGWSVAPLAEGARMEIYDPFDVNSAADYTITGTPMTFTAGALAIPASNSTVTYIHNDRGYALGDNQVTLKYTVGSGIGSTTFIDVIPVYLDANNMIFMRINNSSLLIYKRDAGTDTFYSGAVGGSFAVGQTYWIVGRKEGNTLFVEWWNTEPTLGEGAGSMAGSYNTTLSGADATKYGQGVTSQQGFSITSVSANVGWTANEFKVEPYVYKGIDLPQQISLDGPIPGDAPATVDVTVAQFATAGSVPAFGLIGWHPRADPFNYVWNGGGEADTNGWTATAGYANGAGTSISRNNSLPIKYGNWSIQVITPATANTGGRFRIYKKFRKGVTYTWDFWIRSIDGNTTAFLAGMVDPSGRFSMNGGGVTSSGSLTTTWTRYTQTFVPDADFYSGDMTFRVAAATATTFQLDGVQVYEGTTAPTRQNQIYGRGADRPFGVIEGEAASGLTTWAVTSDGTARSGFNVSATSSGVGSAVGYWTIDPSLLVADDLADSEVTIELWARMKLSTSLISPRLTFYGLPTWAPTVRYSQEFGTLGKLVVPTSQWQTYRCGTLTLPTTYSTPWNLGLTLSWASGTSSAFHGVDYLIAVPVRRRAASPTGKVKDSSYPLFFQGTATSNKLITSDLRGFVNLPSGVAPTSMSNSRMSWSPDTGLGGANIWFPPGNMDAVVKLSGDVPDAPTFTNVDNQVETATVKFSPVPRYFLVRGV